MPLIDEGAFARRFRRAAAADRRDFLAALWEARGYVTEVDADGLIRATRTGEPDPGRTQADGIQQGSTIRIEVVGWLPRGGTDADLVVGTRDVATARRYADRNGAEFLDPTALLPLLAYGVERDVGEHIASAHLGTSLTVDRTPDGTSETSSTTRRAVFALVLLVTVGAVLAISGVGLPFAGGDVDGDFPTPEPADQSVGTPSGDPATDGESAGDTDGRSGYPAGLNGSGVTNATTLVGTHREQVDGRQRTVTLDYRAPANDSVFRGAERHEATAAIHTADRYLLVAEYYGNRTDETPASRARSWADGERVHHLADGTDRERDYSTRPLGETSLVTAYESFVLDRYEDAMGVGNTSVETVSASGVTLYAVTATGTPEWFVDEIEGFRAVAHLTTEGRLVRLTISYTHQPTDEAVRLVATYQHLDDVAPPPEPEWVREERGGEDADGGAADDENGSESDDDSDGDDGTDGQ